MVEFKQGSLSDYFQGVGVKRLSETEINPEVSRGHEFQGVEAFQQFLGVPPEKQRLAATYIWLSDDDAPLQYDGSVTWYDSRQGQKHRDAEPRFYYPAAAETVVYRSRAGDTLFVAVKRDGDVLFVICPQGSAVEQQLLWLFGLEVTGDEIPVGDLRASGTLKVGFAAAYLLEALGIEARLENDDWLDRLVARFGNNFPKTSAFSEFARKALPHVSPQESPDAALIGWLELEEVLFRTFERHIVADRLKAGFYSDHQLDLEGFISFSLSVQNRRKARAGYSLENHLQYLFEACGLKFQRGGLTEARKRPDFLFPGSSEYQDSAFPSDYLTLLGAKSSCKDRWRQVLAEGQRVQQKHLLTLELAISEAQTAEMQLEQLSLVVPKPLQTSYKAGQQAWLMSVADFVDLAASRQALAGL